MKVIEHIDNAKDPLFSFEIIPPIRGKSAQEIIDIVRYRKDLNDLGTIDGFGETEQTIVRFTRELVSEAKVSAEVFANAVAIFGYEGVSDITGLVGYYSFIAITLKAFDVQRTVGSELLLPVLNN